VTIFQIGNCIYSDVDATKYFDYKKNITEFHNVKKMYHSEDMSEFIIKVFQDALQHHDKPEIFNTDQRSQFNSTDFTNVLKENKITISMDCRGRALDNILNERLCGSVNYE
jgi:transposase InsO family protein